MVKTDTTAMLRCVRRAMLWHEGGATDAQLLERYIAARDEAAFEALVRRHGSMVLGVCRRVLSCLDDAEDAFQATFLILVKKAASVARRESVGSWLHGVAYRTAQKARLAATRRRLQERRTARPEAVYPHDDDLWVYLRPMLDQELSRLPDKYRELIILCDLEGQTRKQAARRLGYPEGTVSGRLSRARTLLAKRLGRYGRLLSAGMLAHVLGPSAASACPPVPLVTATVKAATLVAAGYAIRGVVSAPVALLTEGVLKIMVLNKMKIIAALALAIGVLGAGLGLYQTRADDGTAGNPGSGVVAVPAGETGDTPVQNDPAKNDKNGKMENINLPKSQPPVQVLASIADGKLVIKTAILIFRAMPGGGVPGGVPVPGPNAPPLPPAGANGRVPGAVPAFAPVVQPVWELQSQTYDLDDVTVLDTTGKKIAKKTVVKLLKKETVALASMWGQPIDPLHLRVIREGTLIFVLPAPMNRPGIAPPPVIIPPNGVFPPQGIPVPLPAPALPPQGGGVRGNAGVGVAAPAVIVAPAAATTPAPPPTLPPQP